MKASGPALIAVPFVCGIAAASSATYNNMVQSEISLALVLFCTVLSLNDGGWGRYAPLAGLFALGWFCYTNSCLIPVQAKEYDLPNAALGYLQARIRAIPFSNPETAHLAEALLSGNRSLLGKDTITAFRVSGASHVLALSGLHLGLIASTVSKLLGLMGNNRHILRLRSFIVISFSAIYTMMCGESPSLVRALIFICIREISHNRKDLGAGSVDALCVAAFIQLAIDPASINSIAFQLSYLAMCGIFLLHPVLKSFYPEGKGIMGRIWESMSLSLSCQVFTAPLVWKTFGSLPHHFLLTNLIALPLVELFIVLCLICISAPEIIPGPIVSFCELIGNLLLKSMQIISTM